MKRIGAIFTLTALIIAMSASVCFAGSLTVEDTYPKDGSKGASIENLGVKVYFSGEMSEDKVAKANEGAFQLYDDEGKKMPTRVLYSQKEKGVVLVLLDNTENKKIKAEGNTEYTLKLSASIVDDKGNTLGKDESISFRTLNQSTNTIISLLMTVVMFGGMIVISSRSMKKAGEEAKKEARVNPYKEAKKTGKSVEEIVEKDRKKKAKEAERAAKAEEEKRAEEEEEYEEDDRDVYKVSRRHSASEAGSQFVAKKRAQQKAKAQAAKRKSGSKGKNKKKKK